MLERQRPPGTVRALTLTHLTVCALLASSSPACGARGPLDDTPRDAGHDAAPAASAEPPGLDAGPEAGAAGPLACGRCLARECGSSVVACVQAPACRTTVQCAVTTCLAGGSPDLSCVIGCASGSSDGAIAALSVFDCATRTCGGDCATVLGTALDALGGLGGGVGSGAPADAGSGGPGGAGQDAGL
jgi:predicted small lipoprotein YifL